MRTAVLGLLLAAALGLPSAAAAQSSPAEMLIYMPYGLIHTARPASEVDGYLAEIDSYGIGQVVFAMPRFKSPGTLRVPKHNAEMLRVYAARTALYDGAHDAALSLTVVFPGKIKTARMGLDLELAATRANIVAAIESSLALGNSGVQLDFEPYPVSPGFPLLLEELDAMFARVGFHGRLSVTAPATISRWSPEYLKRVSALVAQVDPLYYDSESKTVAAYESWTRSSLAYYSANVAPGTRIVPVLPSYSPDPWHIPAVENITTATSALANALADGDRINGAGIWSGWGFLLDEEGAYDGSADRADWLGSTLGLPFAP